MPSFFFYGIYPMEREGFDKEFTASCCFLLNSIQYWSRSRFRRGLAHYAKTKLVIL